MFAAEQALYRSDNGGSSWIRRSCGLVLNDVAVYAPNPNTIYLAADTGEGPYEETEGHGGLLSTDDGGRHWTRFTDFPKRNRDEPILLRAAVDPRFPETVFAVPNAGGVIKSTDGGKHWDFSHVSAHRPLGLDGPQFLSLDFGAGRDPALWGGSQQGVYRADAAGLHWTRMRLPAGSEIVPDPQIANRVYAVAVKPGEPTRIFRSSDRGEHWASAGEPPADMRRVWGLTVATADDSLYAWGQRWIFRSRDHGESWTRLPALPSPTGAE